MVGGYQAREAGECADAIKLVEETHFAAANAKGNCNATSWKVVKVWSQVVAGTNWWFHVEDNNGQKWSVCVFEPLPHTGNPAEISSVHNGHVDAGSA